MSKQTVNHQIAMQVLESAWVSIENEVISPSPEIKLSLESIIGLPHNIAFKYILVTGILAKYVNPLIHPRALQVSSALPGAYDARSLCHSVVVSFEKTKGNLFGLSNEPFLSKPARHPEHDKFNPQLKNKRLAIVLHDVLEESYHSSAEEVFKILVHILRIAQERMKTIVEANINAEMNYFQVLRFVQNFLSEAEGGTRLVAVAGTFLTLLNSEFDVRVYQPNTSDRFAQTVGDIEIWNQQMLISATECKHRPLTLDDIRHGLRKAKEYRVPEYCFTFADNLKLGQELAINSEIIKESENIDVILINIHEIMQAWIVALNPTRRAFFGDKIVEILRNIRKFDTARIAAEMWNKSSQGPKLLDITMIFLLLSHTSLS